MPHGVTVNFLEILAAERRRRRHLLLAVPPLAGLALFLAELADVPPWGPMVKGTAASLVAGLLAGLALASWRAREREENLRERWEAWMRWSLTSQDLRDLEAKVEAPGPRVSDRVAGGLWGLTALVNVLLFVGLWYAWPGIDVLAWGVLLADGLALGVLAAAAAWDLRWSRRLNAALDEMIREGEVGVWGER